MNCDHKCHTVGLNPWVAECPICGCPNKDYDEKISAPTTIDELLNWHAAGPSTAKESEKSPRSDVNHE